MLECTNRDPEFLKKASVFFVMQFGGLRDVHNRQLHHDKAAHSSHLTQGFLAKHGCILFL
jgi:hypothetical protein